MMLVVVSDLMFLLFDNLFIVNLSDIVYGIDIFSGLLVMYIINIVMVLGVFGF